MAETKEDQGINIEATLGKTEDFVNKNKKSLMIIGGAIAVAVAGYLYYQYSYVAGKEKGKPRCSGLKNISAMIH
jgi:hypothetical protein